MTTIPSADPHHGQSLKRFYSPFSLEVDPMSRLMLINFEGDPDEVYTAFEPQVFDDPINGTGFMVIAYGKDGKFDIYHQPGLALGHKNYDMVGRGVGDFIERPFEKARFTTGPQGVNIRFAFEDKQGRLVSVHIKENNRKPPQPFSMLAPFPNAAEKPPTLPLVLLYDFYFVRRAGTEMEVLIGGKPHQPDRLPVPMDGSWMYFIRYATDPVQINWSTNFEGPLPGIEAQGPGKVEANSVVYELEENEGRLVLSAMQPAGTAHTVRWTFNPPFPDITGFEDGAQTGGRFTIEMDRSMGVIAGTYDVQRAGSQVEIKVHPSDGWRPGVSKWSARIMFSLVSLFKRWPQTYQWAASVDLSQPAAPHMQAKWNRTNR